MLDSATEKEQLRYFLEASGIGTWQVDMDSGAFHADDIALSLLNLENNSVTSLSDLFKNTLEAEYEFTVAAFEAALLSGTTGTEGIKVHISTKNYTSRLLLKGSIPSKGSRTFYGTVQIITTESPQPSLMTNTADVLSAMVAEAAVAISLYVGRELIVDVANDIMLSYWGKDKSIIGQKLEVAVPELEGQPFLQILDDVFTTGKIYQVVEEPATLALNGELGTYFFDFTYKPLFDKSGNVYAIMNTAIDVTERVISKRRLEQSESRLRAIIDQSPLAIGLLKGRDMIIEVGNDLIYELWGKDKSITGKTIIEALPEIKDQVFLKLLENVYDTGETFYGDAILAKLEYNGIIKDLYFDFTYSALRDHNGTITGVLIIASEVTQREQTLKKIADSEAKFRALMNAAPAAMVLLVGKDDMIFDMPNQALLELIGRDESISGKPLLEVMPEMEGQESVRLIQNVFATGQKSSSYGRQIKFIKNGELTQNYYNVSYTPIFDSEGNVHAVLDIAIDVTDSIKARQSIEEAEASLRSAIEMADLATWNLDPKTKKVTYSKRLLEWFGLDGEPEELHDVISIIHEKDRSRVATAVQKAISADSLGLYDEEYTVVNRKTGRERIIHAQGKTFFDEDGIPYVMMGIAQDITSHRKVQMALENEVTERTKELQMANLSLEESNRQLINSNEELAQYAYVASHDLQEPLRKISMFSNLLKERDTENKHAAVIEKILGSSRRMSQLIKDLLEFSRLLNPDSRFVKTNLNEIVEAVKNDFELLIEEKNAVIEIGELPVINAVPLQMNQLFYNLISNALKFIPEGVKPKVSVSAKKISINEAAKYIPTTIPHSVYYCLTVSDNGIGIEEKYAKQIFDVFKRLHGRDEYSGSGIGLAICRRIAGNHKGAIYTKSKIGKGTSFHIILPETPILKVNPNTNDIFF